MQTWFKTFFCGILLIGLSANAFASDQNCYRNYSNTQILAWSYEAMLSSYNFSFVNEGKHFWKARQYFKTEAWKSFYRSIQPSLSQVKAKKLVVSVGLENSPVIINQSSKHWRVMLPLIIHYQQQNKDTTVKQTVTLQIAEDDDCAYGKNLKIIDFSINKAKNISN